MLSNVKRAQGIDLTTRLPLIGPKSNIQVLLCPLEIDEAIGAKKVALPAPSRTDLIAAGTRP